MQHQTQRNPTALSVGSLCTSIALVAVIGWLTGPGLSEFNAFNERIFGRYYTAGAILMLGFYGLVFFAISGTAIAAAAMGWLQKGQPRWLTWAAILAAIVAPIVALGLLKGA